MSSSDNWYYSSSDQTYPYFNHDNIMSINTQLFPSSAPIFSDNITSSEPQSYSHHHALPVFFFSSFFCVFISLF